MAEKKPKRQNQQYVVELEEPGQGKGLLYLLGAIGGLAIGALVARGLESLGGGGDGSSDGQRRGPRMPERFRRPARLQRPPAVQDALSRLEGSVIDAFEADDVLAERSIEVGAVSAGMVELSGSVFTREEARHAVSVAQGVNGVQTVINRMEVEAERDRLHANGYSDEDATMSGAEWTGHGSGMGRRRQGSETDPARSDDSHHMREVELEKADRAQFADEGYSNRPRTAERDEVQEANRTNFSEDELDNQSPYGKHAVSMPEQPQAMNSQARVGEGMKPGIELALEKADLPVKPHGEQPAGEDRNT